MRNYFCVLLQYFRRNETSELANYSKTLEAISMQLITHNSRTQGAKLGGTGYEIQQADPGRNLTGAIHVGCGCGWAWLA